MSGILSQMPQGVLSGALSPQDQGLLAMGLGLMARSGPSRMPQSFGSNFGAAGMGALNVYGKAMDDQQEHAAKAQALKLKQQEFEMMKSLRDQQIADMQRRQAEELRKRTLLQSMFTPQAPAQAALGQGAAEGSVGPTVANAERMDAMGGQPQMPQLTPERLMQLAAEGIDPKPFMEIQKGREPKFHNVGGGVLLRQDGDKVTPAFEAPRPAQRPFMRDRIENDQTVQEEFRDGAWVEVGRGPRFARQLAPTINVGGGEGKPPSGYRWKAPGVLEPVPGGPADKVSQGNISDVQRVSAGYASRMQAAEKVMEGLTTGTPEKPGISGKPGILESVAGSLPLVGKAASNVASNPDRQKYRQAQEDWVRSKLRKESGAVIGDEEMDREIRVYFPQIGDSEEVIKQKADARRVALTAMESAAGRADIPTPVAPAPVAAPAPAAPKARKYNPKTGRIE